MSDAISSTSASDGAKSLHKELDATLPIRNITSLFFGLRESTSMLAICAEPGFCQEDVITDLLGEAAKRGVKVLRYNLRFKGCVEASDEVVRVARRTSRLQCSSVVAFDSLPPSDEASARRQARALRRMWEAGVSVVFSLPPEGSQLLEMLPECTVVRSRDLLLGLPPDGGRGDRLRSLRSLSWGIPSLVRCLLPELNKDGEVATIPLSYYEEACGLVSGSLRPSLPDEELRLRLAMHLLGSGTSEDLTAVCGDVSREYLEWEHEMAPIFAISSRLDRFRSLTDVRPEVLEECLSGLSATSSMFEYVCPACIRVLLERGDVARAASLYALPGSDAALPLALENAVPLMDAGRVDILERALDQAAAAGTLDREFEGVLRGAVSALGGDSQEAAASASGIGVGRVAEGALRDVTLFLDLRRVLRAEPPALEFTASEWSEVGRRLLAHREACDLMVRGRLTAATRLLVANPADGAGTHVSSALLCIDLEFARLLLGDAPAGESEEVEAAARLISSQRVPGIRGYADCLDLLRAVLAGRTDVTEAVGQLISRSERCGDALVQLLALLAGCVTDLRTGAIARASVRATLALVLARGLSLEYLARVAALLGRASRYLLGEALEPRDEGAGCEDDLEDVCLLADEAMLPEEEATAMRGEARERVPREALWVLLLLTEGMGPLSQGLNELMPAEWWRALETMRARLMADDGGTRPMDRAYANDPLGGGGVARTALPIDLRLLGGFELIVDGSPVLDGRLEHRNAKPLMEYLALRRGSTAKRYQLVEQIWPDCDYTNGYSRIYQATSVLRSAIGGVRKGLDPFIIGRSTKEVSLNRSLVRCDVDDFRLCAREAVDGTSDERVLEMARAAERLYAGDLYMPAVDATGYVFSVREELRLLYADAMVAGSEAALRLRKSRTSIRLATNALAVDDMREDAVIALVRALKASGRNAEADQQYRRYAGKLLSTSDRPPSKLLRRVAGDAPSRSRAAVVSEAVVG